MPLSSDLFDSLVKAARHLFAAVQTRLNTGNYPKDDPKRGYSSIQNAMSISAPQMDGDKAYIDIIINLNDAPFAAAFEFGSGIHSTKGPRETYPIEPVDAKALKFPWIPSSPAGARGSSKYIGDFGEGSTDWEWVMRKVDHPGIPADPYLIPTLDAEAKKLAEILEKELEYSVYKAILGDTPTKEVFVVKA